MKRHAVVRGALILLGFAFAGACAASPPPAPQTADIEAAVQEQVRQWYQAAADLDPDLFTRFWSRESVIGWANSGRLETSVDAMTEAWHTMAGNRAANSIECQSISVHVFTPDRAMAMCTGTWTVERTNGTANSYDVLGTSIWAREANGWKMIFLQEAVRVQQAADPDGGIE